MGAAFGVDTPLALGGGGAQGAYSPSVPGNWSPPPTTVAEALDQLAARMVVVEAAVSSLPPISLTSDTVAVAGNAAYLRPGGHIALATGANRASYIYGANIGIGGSVLVYPSGSRCPVSLPAGDLYRQPDGSITNAPPVSGDDTQFMGVSDGTTVAVNILDEVLAP